MKWLLRLILILLLAPGVSGGAPQFLSGVDTSPLRQLGAEQRGRVVPLAQFADAFVQDVHGRAPMLVDNERIDSLAVLFECALYPERALEWCTVASPGDALPRLAGEALTELAFGLPSAEADAIQTGEYAVLEARLMLLVFAGEELRLVPGSPPTVEWVGLDRISEPGLGHLLDRLRAAWITGDLPTINAAIEDFAAAVGEHQRGAGVSAFRLRLERLLARTHLLSLSVVLYSIAAILAMLLPGPKWPLMVMSVSLLVHLAAAIGRAIVMDRLPIQNHYESMIAVAALVAGVSLYAGRRSGGSTVLAVGAGLSAAFIGAAEWLEVPGRILELEAGILSSTAILKYHVLAILAGYALILLGAGIGSAVLVKRLRGAKLDELSALHRLQVNLGYLVFWILGVGILLGAVWADRAWGRWWAFDPKETWALVTWMVYLGLVHIPATKLAAHRRPVLVAILHLLGFLAMMWTYFGVNLLLPSLHSYA